MTPKSFPRSADSPHSSRSHIAIAIFGALPDDLRGNEDIRVTSRRGALRGPRRTLRVDGAGLVRRRRRREEPVPRPDPAGDAGHARLPGTRSTALHREGISRAGARALAT